MGLGKIINVTADGIKLPEIIRRFGITDAVCIDRLGIDNSQCLAAMLQEIYPRLNTHIIATDLLPTVTAFSLPMYQKEEEDLFQAQIGRSRVASLNVGIRSRFALPEIFLLSEHPEYVTAMNGNAACLDAPKTLVIVLIDTDRPQLAKARSWIESNFSHTLIVYAPVPNIDYKNVDRYTVCKNELETKLFTPKTPRSIQRLKNRLDSIYNSQFGNLEVSGGIHTTDRVYLDFFEKQQMLLISKSEINDIFADIMRNASAHLELVILLEKHVNTYNVNCPTALHDTLVKMYYTIFRVYIECYKPTVHNSGIHHHGELFISQVLLSESLLSKFKALF